MELEEKKNQTPFCNSQVDFLVYFRVDGTKFTSGEMVAKSAGSKLWRILPLCYQLHKLSFCKYKHRIYHDVTRIMADKYRGVKVENPRSVIEWDGSLPTRTWSEVGGWHRRRRGGGYRIPCAPHRRREA